MSKPALNLNIFQKKNVLIYKPGSYETEMGFSFIHTPSCNSPRAGPGEVLVPQDLGWETTFLLVLLSYVSFLIFWKLSV